MVVALSGRRLDSEEKAGAYAEYVNGDGTGVANRSVLSTV